MLTLKALEKHNMKIIVEERAKVPESLRTAQLLNLEKQLDYYESELCNRESRTRYWSVYENDDIIAYGGVENILWENGIGELSLLVFEDYRNKGFGKEIVDKFLDNAFNYIGLANVFLECYTCNKLGIIFWQKIIDKYKAYSTLLPNRKYFRGEYHDSLYANITKENYNENSCTQAI